MDKYNKLTLNTVIVFIGTAGSKLISFIMLPFYTKYLSVSDYGITDSINTYVSLLIGVITICMADAIFVFSNQEKDEDKIKYFSSGICIAFLGISIYTVFIILVKKLINVESGVFFEYAWFILLLLITSFIQNYLQNFLKGLNKMFLFSITGILNTIFMALVAIYLIPKYGVMGYIYSIGIANVLSSFIIIIFGRYFRYIKIHYVNLVTIKDLLKFSLPLIPNSVMWWLLSASNRPIMEKYVGNEGIGLYAVANKLPSIIVILFTIFINSLIVSLLEEYKKPGFNKFYNDIFIFIFSIQIIVASILSLFGSFFIRIITTKDSFYDAWLYIPFLSLSVILSNSASYLGCTFTVAKKTKYYFFSSLFGGITALICNILFVKNWGVMGACIAVLLSNMILLITRYIYSYKIAELKNRWYYLIFLILFIFFSICVINKFFLQYILFIVLIISATLQVLRKLKGLKKHA